MPVRIALIGLGKIARDEHLPAIAASNRFQLAATVDPVTAGLPHVPHFPDLAALLANGPKLAAVALCMPPRFRRDLAEMALTRGLHVLLEKPPAATFQEAERLRLRANTAGVTLFAAWHSRFAPGVEPARRWLAQRDIKRVRATWHEDVRVWHPGQDWIWQEEGFGILDPGINALSILTRILPLPFRLTHAKHFVPANWQTPIAANLSFHDTKNAEIVLDLDWTKTGAPRWDIAVETDLGVVQLAEGGAVLSLPGQENWGQSKDHGALSGEYPALYAHFARLMESKTSDADMTPLLHVTEAFDIAAQQSAEPFEF